MSARPKQSKKVFEVVNKYGEYHIREKGIKHALAISAHVDDAELIVECLNFVHDNAKLVEEERRRSTLSFKR